VGSDDVVQAVSEWFIFSRQDHSETDPEGLIKLMDIIVMMRKDLGYSTSQIGPVDLLRTFINDLDEILATKK